VGKPPPTTALIAVPSAKDGVIARLGEHYAQGHIDVEQYEALVVRVEEARTDAELHAIMAPLPALPLPERHQTGQVTETIAATFSSSARRGRFTATSRLVVRATFGDVELDLSDATLRPGETTLDVRAVFGAVRVVVPEGLRVECDGRALFGSFEQLSAAPLSTRDKRVLVVKGQVWFGSFEIVVKPRPSPLARLGAGIKGLLSG